MIQENKFIFKFIYGVLIDELCESAQLITNQDLSRLAKSLENTHVKNINISPSLVDIPQSDHDIFIVFDDVGSYSVVMKPPFILPNVSIIEIHPEQLSFKLIKKRETFDDLLELERIDD